MVMQLILQKPTNSFWRTKVRTSALFGVHFRVSDSYVELKPLFNLLGLLQQLYGVLSVHNFREKRFRQDKKAHFAILFNGVRIFLSSSHSMTSHVFSLTFT